MYLETYGHTRTDVLYKDFYYRNLPPTPLCPERNNFQNI